MMPETTRTMAEPAASIDFAHFAQIDLRVGTVTNAIIHPDADKLLVLTIDDGSGEPRQICAGIRAWYEPEKIIDRQVVFVANLEPRKLRGQISQGMVLAATAVGDDAEGDVVLVGLDGKVPAGSRVS